MIICPNCGRENEDHYKFCLGCGTEISKDDAAAPAAPVVAPTALPRASAAPAPKVMSSPPASVPPASVPPAPKFEPSFPSGPPLAQAPEPDAETMDRPVDDSMDEPMTPDASVDLGPPDMEQDMGTRPTLLSSPAVPEPVADAEPAPAEPAQAEPVAPVAEDVERTDPEAQAASIPQPEEEEDLPFARPTGDTPAPQEIVDAFAQREAPLEAADSGTPTLFTPRPSTVEATPAPAVQTAARECRSCAAVVPEGFKFCGVCGARYEEAPAPVAAPVAAPGGAVLVLVHPDGTDGDAFALEGEKTNVGRDRAEPLFAQDPFLSPQHATFYFAKGQLFIRDEASLNGVFLRIKAEVELFHNDQFRVGQQLMRFEEMSQVRPTVPGAGDGTTVMGSPVRGCWGRLASIVGIDTAANVWPLRQAETYIGRERGDVRYPEDGFVSGSHAKVSAREGRYFLTDLDSTNGTYLRIKGEGLLTSGDLLLIGQQLFRVELG